MGKMGLAGASLVSAIPGGALFALLLFGLLGNLASMPMMLKLVVLMGMLISLAMAAFPVYALVAVGNGPKVAKKPKVKKEKVVKEKPVKEKKSLWGKGKTKDATVAAAAAGAAAGVDIGFEEPETDFDGTENLAGLVDSEDWDEASPPATMDLDAESSNADSFVNDLPEDIAWDDDDSVFMPSEDFEEASLEHQNRSDDNSTVDPEAFLSPRAETVEFDSVEHSSDDEDDFMSSLGIDSSDLDEPALAKQDSGEFEEASAQADDQFEDQFVDELFEEEAVGEQVYEDLPFEDQPLEIQAEEDDFLSELGLDDEPSLGVEAMDDEEELEVLEPDDSEHDIFENSESLLDEEFDFEFFDDDEEDEKQSDHS